MIVTNRNNHPGHSIDDRVISSSHIGGNYRHPGSACLKGDETGAFIPRCQRVDVSGCHRRRCFRPIDHPGKLDGIANAKGAGFRLKPLSQRSATNNNEPCSRPDSNDLGSRAQERRQILRWHQPAHGQHQGVAARPVDP